MPEKKTNVHYEQVSFYEGQGKNESICVPNSQLVRVKVVRHLQFWILEIP